MIPNKYNFFAMKQSHFFLTPMTWVTDTACNCLSISGKHSLYGYNTHKGIVAHIELYF